MSYLCRCPLCCGSHWHNPDTYQDQLQCSLSKLYHSLWWTKHDTSLWCNKKKYSGKMFPTLNQSQTMKWLLTNYSKLLQVIVLCKPERTYRCRSRSHLCYGSIDLPYMEKDLWSTHLHLEHTSDCSEAAGHTHFNLLHILYAFYRIGAEWQPAANIQFRWIGRVDRASEE